MNSNIFHYPNLCYFICLSPNMTNIASSKKKKKKRENEWRHKNKINSNLINETQHQQASFLIYIKHVGVGAPWKENKNSKQGACKPLNREPRDTWTEEAGWTPDIPCKLHSVL